MMNKMIDRLYSTKGRGLRRNTMMKMMTAAQTYLRPKAPRRLKKQRSNPWIFWSAAVFLWDSIHQTAAMIYCENHLETIAMRFKEVDQHQSSKSPPGKRRLTFRARIKTKAKVAMSQKRHLIRKQSSHAEQKKSKKVFHKLSNNLMRFRTLQIHQRAV